MIQKFPVRRGTHGVHGGGKLLAYSFLLGVTLLVFHSDRKLFAKGFLLGVTPLVFLTDRKLFAKEISRLRFRSSK